jgi:hypothetical protein
MKEAPDLGDLEEETNWWLYEADEKPKQRHSWQNKKAGFIEVKGVLIGKCPKGQDPKVAETLLNDGIPYFPPRSWNHWHPKSIFIIHDGAVFRALPTVPGKSYHAFPEKERIPPRIRQQILDKARKLGCFDKVRRWLAGKT